MILQVGFRYVREDGRITDPLTDNGGVGIFHDKKHDKLYRLDGSLIPLEGESLDEMADRRLIIECKPMLKSNGRGGKGMILQAGQQYICEDGRVTDPLADNRGLGIFHDKKYGYSYDINGGPVPLAGQNQLFRDNSRIVAEYHKPETIKTVKRWNWVGEYAESADYKILIMRTEKEARETASRNKIMLLGRIQESLIETEE